MVVIKLGMLLLIIPTQKRSVSPLNDELVIANVAVVICEMLSLLNCTYMLRKRTTPGSKHWTTETS